MRRRISGFRCLFLCLEVRKSNVFEAVKQAVPTRQAAESYGVQVGKNGMACCPFHDDKHPSMKVDRRFHCFGCQADGDVIDFTARLFGLSSKEAALKLAEDFSVSYDAKGHDPPRIRSCLHHFLGADESDYVEEMLKHFLLGAIRRVFSPGCKYEEMLCLVGGQGAGKSSFFRLLAIRDEWFSDDLKKLDDDRVFLKLQGHWIIEMSEMLATSSAKSIEEIRSFISRQKETYRTPYEAQPKDRLRQCVFGGSSNTLDFLPLDRAGNRRFLPIMIYPENAEVHILEDEDASRAYLLQVWAEAMTIYRSGRYSMKFSKSIQRQLVEVQKDFMPEDTEAGQIQGFLEHYTGSMVCSKQLFKEALGHTYDEPKRWQLHNINEIMNTVVTGWKPFSNPRMFAGYGRQKGWERDVSGNELPGNEDGFVELSEEECRQLELPKEWIA